MLTQDDVAWIRENRAEITAARTESVTIIHETETGKDPYTGEPIMGMSSETVAVVWKDIAALSAGDLQIIGGVALEVGDVRMTLPPDIDVSTTTLVQRDGVDYRIVAYDERGIGGKNRYECVVRRVT